MKRKPVVSCDRGRRDARMRFVVGAGALALALSTTMTCARPAPPMAGGPGVARVQIDGPTVIAWLVVPEGAVDTLPDLAVIADDWNFAMAALGESLATHGIAYALVTDSVLRVPRDDGGDVRISLGAIGQGGYVFAAPDAPPCVRRDLSDATEVPAIARRLLASRPAPEDREACEALSER